MPSPAPDAKNAILEPVLKLAGARLPAPSAAEAREFITLYYDQVDAEDLARRAPEDLYGAALSHLAFVRRFHTGSPKLRVYNPRAEEHGWSSTHTVVEIVNDDMPFLVDSVTMELSRQGFTVHLLVHPLARTRRDEEGQLEAFAPAGKSGAGESYIHVEVDRETDPARLKALGDGLAAVLGDVRAAVEDWPAMRGRMEEIVKELARVPKGVDKSEAAETREFLAWVADNHFTFLGYRDYQLSNIGGEDMLRIVAGTGLGVLREPRLGGVSASFQELPARLKALAREPRPLVLTKANSRATVHRSGYLDYIGVKRFDAAGRVAGERRFVGLYTSSAYHADPVTIPLLRSKVARIVERAGFPPASHGHKNLVSMLQTYPRDELLQVDEDTLLDIALGILRLGERRRTRVFLRRDVYGRFWSCLVFLPRDSYNTDMRMKIQSVLMSHLKGTSAEYNLQLTDAVLARIHVLVRTSPKDETKADARAIETQIALATRRWEDDLRESLSASAGEDKAVAALRAYSFPVAYREAVNARMAVRDIAVLDRLGAGEPHAVTLYRPVEADARSLRLRVYRAGARVPLSGSLPILENLGLEALDEVSWEIGRNEGGSVFLHDFGVRASREIPDVEAIKAPTEEALLRVVKGEIENDAFNRLTPAAATLPDDVVVLRAYAKYLKQAGFPFSLAYLAQTLAAHPGIVSRLTALFRARFDPAFAGDRAKEEKRLGDEVIGALNDVANLDEDRILRRFLYAIRATVRTNHWVAGEDGRRKPTLSLKIESAKVPELPEPRPLFEVFVYSPRFEAIHLRGGKVARGGLRWSDRPEDFRTEILGLMKAQMVKNAVIVPVGSKGGFVLKAAPPASEREATLAEGVACYKNFLRGLLDVTDNLVAGKVVPPKGVVRHDPDDPYLVVAADKGTAAFSDYANGVSAEYGFWLADAFASGGSAGYDHKKMGITARGAWESVKRHFREMGHDTQSKDFTVVGVGDMSGDVFGNGMLLSRHIRLLAAFDHRHIFLDPNPEPEKSFLERERLFALPRSSWEDYDKAAISKGGGVFARSAKAIPISAPVGKALGIDEPHLTPAELMKAILRAPVDLLYNGGIGTYVKAHTQSHADVGDRANDAIRVNGNELRCKVVAEGGNLGFTQLGRVEFAQAGGRILTDAIDNSAGVDCSDHEVNIKILLGLVAGDGELTVKQRDKLLAQMTEEVGHLVLADNYYQTQSLSVSGVRGEKLLDAQAAFMRALEKMGRLNRAVEFLPDDDEIAERRAAKAGLMAPERAVLLAYSKMVLFDELLKGTLIDEAYVAQALAAYFPRQIRERYADTLPGHPLRREIVATGVANGMINRVGSVFVHRMQEETGASMEEVVRAFVLVRDIFGLDSLWAQVDGLDNRVPCELQSELFIEAGRLVLRATLWFLRRRREKLPIARVIAIFQPAVKVFGECLPGILAPDDRESWEASVKRLAGEGVSEPLARRLASLGALYAVLDATEVSQGEKRPVESVASLYFALAGDLELRWVGERITALPTDTSWQALARNALRDDLAAQQRALTAAVVKLSPEGAAPPAMLAAWKERYAQPLARLAAMREELKRAGNLDLAVLSVLLRELRALA